MLQLHQTHDSEPVPYAQYQLATPLDLFVSEKYFGIALTHLSDATHIIQSPLGRQSYTFNGYFTSVRVE